MSGLASNSCAAGSSAPPASPVLSDSPAVVVIGAGCVGLAVAIQLLQSGYQNVHIVTKTTTPLTTSDQAGALWRPFGEVSEGNRPVFQRWGKETFDFLNSLRLRYGASKTGICLVSGYEVFSTPQPKPFWADDVMDFKIVSKEELAAAGLVGHGGGFFYTSLIVDMDLYLPWLHREYRRLGGKLHLKEIQCLSEVQGKYFPNARLIINCSGLAAAQLVGDKSMFPVAGHIVKLKSPSIHHFYRDSENPAGPSYIFPRLGDLVVGGTYHKHRSCTKPNIDHRNEILERATRLCPDIADATMVGEYVGLRPYRDLTRLEIEYPASSPKGKNQTLMSTAMPSSIKLPVIHNYGHGGSGITLHWGCGVDTLKLVKPVLGPGGPAPTVIAKL